MESVCSFGNEENKCLPCDKIRKIEEKLGGSIDIIIEKYGNTFNALKENKNKFNRQEFKELLRFYKPIGPRLDNNRREQELISNFDIIDILNQFMTISSHFYSLGYNMLDFEKTRESLVSTDYMQKYKMGYTQFGVVINTDYSTGQGKHWFAMFINLEPRNKLKNLDKIIGLKQEFIQVFKKYNTTLKLSNNNTEEYASNNNCTIEYFNSSGNSPKTQIVKFMEDHKAKFEKEFNKPFKILTNVGVQHQHEETECGVYAIIFILARILGIPFETFVENKIRDDVMLKFRNNLFLE